MLALAALAAGAMFLMKGPIPQAAEYHRFADERGWLGIPRAANVLSNAAFLIAGMMGLRACRRSFPERGLYKIFFAGAVLVCVGSGYYHLAPDNARLVWDRLPMTIAFMSLVSAVVSERISVRIGSALLWPLVLLGLASVVYWRWSALAGFENLRPYLAVQYGSIAVVLAVSLLYRSRYTHGWVIFVLAAAYGIAKVVEIYDRPIFDAGQWLSGHTLKHLAAALGIYLLLLAMQRRARR